MMPIRSLGRPSMNFRVTSRIASMRVADSPPTLKSFVNIEAETSRASMMSIPLASIWVRVFPSCGRAIATAKNARLTSIKARRNLPARVALVLPSDCKAVVEENVRAAASPVLPRNQARSGIASRRSRNHGCPKVSAEFAGNQSRRFKLRSFHKVSCFFQESAAVLDRSVVAGKLDQVAAAQEVLEQQSFFCGKRRTFRQHGEKFNRGLPCYRQCVFFCNVTAQDIGHGDTELIWRHGFHLALDLRECVQRAVARRTHRLRSPGALSKPPSDQTKNRKAQRNPCVNAPGRHQRIIHRRRDLMNVGNREQPIHRIAMRRSRCLKNERSAGK